MNDRLLSITRKKPTLLHVFAQNIDFFVLVDGVTIKIYIYFILSAILDAVMLYSEDGN